MTDSFFPFCCPVCGEALSADEKRCFCANGHSFDKARSGYVNLLLSQSSSGKRHGDDRRMVRARSSFLERGFYEPISTAATDALRAALPAGSLVFDCGCGEGYYTAAAQKAGFCVAGVDISKDALNEATKRGLPFLAVASAFRLPFADKSADAILDLFAPSAYDEFVRVLKDDGILLKVVPLSLHLHELKEAVYENPYPNKPEQTDERFCLVGAKELKYSIHLSSPDEIRALFEMTPYFYKTGVRDTEKLLALNELEVTVHVAAESYRRLV